MPEKLPRKRDANAAPSTGLSVPDVETALILGFAHVTHGATLAAGEVACPKMTAGGHDLDTCINSFWDCL
jgi:hypothetical protein